MDRQSDTTPNNIQNPADNLQISNDWQVLSPVAILYFTVSLFKHLFGNLIYLIPVLAVSYKSVFEHPLIWLPGILVFFILLTFFAFVSFKVYRYRLTVDSIEIRSGIFSKKHLNLPFIRVQNIKIEQPVYYRLTGHACLQLDTAGSAKNEAILVAIKLDFAQQLKTRIQSQIQHHAIMDPQQDNKSAATPEFEVESASRQIEHENIINQRNLSDLIIHGISSNRIWIFLGGLAPFYGKVFESVSEWLTSLGINITELFNLQTHSVLEIGLYVLSLTMLVVLVLVSFSVVGAIVSFYGYTLSKQGDKYIRRSGLFTKHEVSMRLSRLQMIVQKQDWLDVLLKRIDLKFEQTNSFSKNQDASASNNKIIVPSIKLEESQALIDDAYPNNSLNRLICNNGFESISKRFILRNIMLLLMPTWLLITFATLVNNKLMIAVLFSLFFIGLCALVVLRWKRWGIARDENFVYLRKGLIGIDYYCFPIYKLQQTQFKQTLLMKKRQLATVKFVLASGTLKVPMINQKLAYKLIDEGLYQVESSQKSWM